MPNRKNSNPDVLSCLANLSNDEVFTPPALANAILDLLPAEIWRDKNAKFLDPASKTGVFLREIAKRLLAGLAAEIPDLLQRINHIFKNQIYGIAVTELTAYLTRRSVYCSKDAKSKYSVCGTVFDDDSGNIRFARTKHPWNAGKCVFCGANQENYDRGAELESHAYEFIHTKTPEEIFNMKFDVIVGNPPYQLSDGGGGIGTSAIPLYDKFVHQAKKMSPRFLSMIIPARWFSGGRGLDEFRDEMLNDKHIRKIVDYFDPNDCFPGIDLSAGIDLSGGVCYFLWDRDNPGECEVKSILNSTETTLIRPLLENNNDTFIRFNQAISIYRKTFKKNEGSFSELASSMKPFGLRTYFKGKTSEFENSVKVYAYPENSYIDKSEITQNVKLIDKYKVFIAGTYGERGKFPYMVTAKPFIGEPNTCCSETYLLFGPFKTKREALNVISYMQTRFFRFLVLLIKNTPRATKKVYTFVPIQDFSEPWTDEKLYAKYSITAEEQAFIESMIRPMDLSRENKIKTGDEEV
jgi:site-specific DNA-methyltransferase (adenine-specific)